MRKDEQAVQDLQACMKDFDAEPFDISSPKLRWSMRKTVKSKSLELFNLDPVIEDPRDHCSLVDMGLIWQLATPTPEDREARKRDGSEYLWSDYLEKISAIIFSRHANASHIILVNDKYDLPHWTIM
ncbi:hypothetical protein F7725_026884 [Dissostichus mawsoni]|uniref:Uncharacterized protein n=1 Tax=Dissostichus mawsoni TaxID=36200 RepID=A0A7J5X978_DISMA|nr:hypothetical protein F7725_026884 [Dissostichus mawsoni]